MLQSKQLFLKANSDIVGAAASFLCFIHCVITPFFFLAQTCSITCAEGAPFWWKWIDYIVLAISFFAVNHAIRHSTLKNIKIILWSSWLVLAILLINEHTHFFALPEWFVYIPTFGLILGHLYNYHSYRCKMTLWSPNSKA